jgi:hypothetical protein
VVKSANPTQQAEAHLAAGVQVWVEAHLPTPRGEELHARGFVGVLRRQENVELKRAAAVRRVGRRQYQRAQHAHVVVVYADANRAGPELGLSLHSWVSLDWLQYMDQYWKSTTAPCFVTTK